MSVSKAAGFLALALSFAGCNAILGIDKAEPILDGSAGGQGGLSGGSGGSDASTGGLGGTGPTGGSGGLGGSAGASGGTAGADANPCVDVKTDAKNCGWCGHDCKETGCSNGLCLPTELHSVDFGTSFAITADSIFVGTEVYDLFKIAKVGFGATSWTGTSDIYNVTVHGDRLYFNEYYTKLIYTSPISGALAPTPLITANASINGMTVDETGIYYAEHTTNTIRRAALDGTGAKDLVLNATSAWHLATDATNLYFSSVLDGLYVTPKNATTAVDENSLPYFYDIVGPGPATLMLDGNWVYFSTGDPTYYFPDTSSQLRRISKDKSQNQTLADATTLIYGVAVADGYAYFTEEGTSQTDYTDGAVRRVKLDSPGAQPETIAEKQVRPIAVAVDGEWLYWLSAGWTNVAGSLSRVAR